MSNETLSVIFKHCELSFNNILFVPEDKSNMGIKQLIMPKNWSCLLFFTWLWLSFASFWEQLFCDLFEFLFLPFYVAYPDPQFLWCVPSILCVCVHVLQPHVQLRRKKKSWKYDVVLFYNFEFAIKNRENVTGFISREKQFRKKSWKLL